LAGTNFFKNYRLIFDWPNEELIMIETKKYENTRFNNFGFSANFSDDKLIIGFLFNQSSAEKAGLKLGDQIIGINEKDYSEITLDGWCEILNEKLIAEDVDSISITVSREEKNLTFNLTKSMILTE
jgi:C-terminal processing protease CtpA/Prc